MESYNRDKLKDILKKAEEERYKLKHPYVGSEHLFLALVKSKNSLSEYLNKYNLNYESFKKELLNVVGSCKKNNEVNLYTPLLRKIINKYESKSDNKEYLYEDMFLSILDEGEGIAVRIFIKMNIDLEEIYLKLKEKQKINEMTESNKIGVILNDKVDMSESIYNRDEEINKIIMTLSRKKKCNPLLIGKAGVGKSAIIEELARRINNKKVPKSLFNKKIINLELGSLISGTKYRGEFEERLNKIIKEVLNNGNTIIFIDEIHSLVSAGGAEGAINASDILKPYLSRGDLKCIGATTIKEYNESILKDKALSRRFEVININEPTNKEMKYILKKIKKEYELYHDIKIDSKAIEYIINNSDKYLSSTSNPDKAIDLLDSSCAYAKLNNKKELSEEDVINTIYSKTNNHIYNNYKLFNFLLNNCKNYDINISELISDIKNHKSKKPISILIGDIKLYEELKNILCDNNIVNIDLNDYMYDNSNSIFKNKNLNNTPLKNISKNESNIIFINNLKYANGIIKDELIKINNESIINLDYDEELNFNNSLIISYLKSDNISPGFNNYSNKVLDNNLINSFEYKFINNKIINSK